MISSFLIKYLFIKKITNKGPWSSKDGPKTCTMVLMIAFFFLDGFFGVDFDVFFCFNSNIFY